MSLRVNALLGAVGAILVGGQAAQGAYIGFDSVGWVVSWPDSQQTTVALDGVSADGQTATLDVTAILDASRIQIADLINPLVLTFQQTKADAAPYLVLNTSITNQSGLPWDGMSFKVVQNQSAAFYGAGMHIGDGTPNDSVAPYDSAQFNSTYRILSFGDGSLDDGHSFITNSKIGQIIVAAPTTPHTGSGDFSLKVGATLGAKPQVPEPGSAMVFVLGGLVMLGDRRRKSAGPNPTA